MVAVTTGEYRQIEVRPLSGALGAEIFGVDLALPLSKETVAEIHAAWLEHLAVFFRDQLINTAQATAFARNFGDLDRYPFIAPLPDYPPSSPGVSDPAICVAKSR